MGLTCKTIVQWMILVLIGVSFIVGYFETRVAFLARIQRPTVSSLSFNTTLPILGANRSVWFVHIGKAGGETIKEILLTGCLSRRNPRHRQDCLDQLPPSRLSDVVFGYSHCFQHQAPRKSPNEPLGRSADAATSLLINTRHPLDRVLSWFYMIHPGACQPSVNYESAHCSANRTIFHNPDSWIAQFFQCFPTVNEWATVIETGTPTACSNLSSEAIAGRLDLATNPLAAHMVANYRGNFERLPERELLVVRTEFLWSDLARLDRLLDGTGSFTRPGHAVTHGSDRNALKRTLQPEEATHFCCALADEMLIYGAIITRAVNLNGAEKSATLQVAAERCNARDWPAYHRMCGLDMDGATGDALTGLFRPSK